YPKNSETGVKTEGILLYLKPTIMGNEPVELKHYAEANPTFPHQSTADQLFDEKQFEAYRELGFFTMNGMLEKIKPNHDTLASMFKSVVRERPRIRSEKSDSFGHRTGPVRRWRRMRT